MNVVFAEMHPAPQGSRLGDLPGLFKTLPRMEPEDLRDFARDVVAVKKQLNRVAERGSLIESAEAW